MTGRKRGGAGNDGGNKKQALTTARMEPSPAAPSKSEAASAVDISLVCHYCSPAITFATTSSRKSHDKQQHAEEKGCYAPPLIQDRSETETLFKKYLPVLPEGMTKVSTDLGIYIRNDNGQVIAAFHLVISDQSVTPSDAARIRYKVALFPGSGYDQGHIIPATSARDDPKMYELSHDPDNFEPLHPRMNADVGGRIEEYCQRLHHDWKWKVCVFILLDKTNTLGTLTATNGKRYPISSHWSYLVFMERGHEQFYEAFRFPNCEPTRTYQGYRTTIDELRLLSGLEFDFHMTESISQHWRRVKQEKYVRDNPFPCRITGCSKRCSSEKRRREHEYSHNPVRQANQKQARAKNHLSKSKLVIFTATTPDKAD